MKRSGNGVLRRFGRVTIAIVARHCHCGKGLRRVLKSPKVKVKVKVKDKVEVEVKQSQSQSQSPSRS